MKSFSAYSSFEEIFSNQMELRYNITNIHSLSWEFHGTRNSNSKYQNQALLNFGPSYSILILSIVHPCFPNFSSQKKNRICDINHSCGQICSNKFMNVQAIFKHDISWPFSCENLQQ